MPTQNAITSKQAKRLLQAQIRRGQKLSSQRPNSEEANLQFADEAQSWSDSNYDTLQSFAKSPATQYRQEFPPESIIDDDSHMPPATVRAEIHSRVAFLKRQLLLLPEEAASPSVSRLAPARRRSIMKTNRKRALSSRKVFIVHGHDELATLTVSRFLDQKGLRTIILREKPNAGDTLIEKLERHARSVGYAVVLLTPDDVGRSKQAGHKNRPRARQNVVLELGYFLARLGRDKVIVLQKGQPEQPSDFLGVVYIPMDDGSWKEDLVNELAKAGLKMNRGMW